MHPFTKFRIEHRPPMSKADLGRMLGVSRSYIHRIETGSRKVGVDLLPAALDRTGIPLHALRPDLQKIKDRIGSSRGRKR